MFGIEKRSGQIVCKRELEGKRVLLTGGSSGIGWYLATKLVGMGAYVVVTSRRDERLKQLRLAVGNPLRRLIAIPGDVADPAHRQHLIDTAQDQFGGIDLVYQQCRHWCHRSLRKSQPRTLATYL